MASTPMRMHMHCTPATCTLHMHHAHSNQILHPHTCPFRAIASSVPFDACNLRPPEAPVRHFFPLEVPLCIFLIHEHHPASLQILAHLISLLVICCLAGFVALLDELLDLLVSWRVRRPLAFRHIGIRIEGCVFRTVDVSALLQGCQGQVGDRLAL